MSRYPLFTFSYPLMFSYLTLSYCHVFQAFISPRLCHSRIPVFSVPHFHISWHFPISRRSCSHMFIFPHYQFSKWRHLRKWKCAIETNSFRMHLIRNPMVVAFSSKFEKTGMVSEKRKFQKMMNTWFPMCLGKTNDVRRSPDRFGIHSRDLFKWQENNILWNK